MQDTLAITGRNASAWLPSWSLSALLDVYDNMMTSLSNNPKSSVDMIYLDYAKAFDKVNHGVLLNKLKTFGICGKLGEWLHSFLTNRRHHVRIPGGVSKSDNVLSGVVVVVVCLNRCICSVQVSWV